MKIRNMYIFSKTISILWCLSFIPMIWYFHMLSMAATDSIPNATHTMAVLISMPVFWVYPFFGLGALLSLIIQFTSIIFSFYIIIISKSYNETIRKDVISLAVTHIFFAGFITSWKITFNLKFLSEWKKRFQKNKITNFWSSTKWLQNMINISPFLLLLMPLPSLVLISHLEKSYFEDNNLIYEDVFISTDPMKPNFIEWFHDGLDDSLFSVTVSSSDTFNDFFAYTKVVTESYSTSDSIRGMYAGPEHATWTDNRENKTKIFYKHLESGHSSDNIVMVGAQPFVDSSVTGYHAGWSGDPTYSEEIFRGVNVLGWKEARDKSVEKYGITGYSPDFITHHYAFNNLDTKSDVEPLRMYVNDHFSHFPNLTSPKGKVSILPGKSTDGYYAFGLSMEVLIERLKSIKDPISGFSAYDNTTIMVYGDHGTHSQITLSDNESGYTGKNRSMILVKPLNSSKTELTYNNDRYFSSAYYPMIMNEILARPQNTINFMNTNINFDKKMFLPTLVDDKFMLTTFKDDVNVVFSDEMTNGWVSKIEDPFNFQRIVSEAGWKYE